LAVYAPRPKRRAGGTEDAIQFDSTLDPNNTITLHDVVKANLTAADFHFV
jgi:hypothetical protein